LLMLFLGWEGVGLASYLLIGYYYRKPSAVAAAKKAFIVNRVGDFGFMLGLLGIFLVFGSISFNEILPAADLLHKEATGVYTASDDAGLRAMLHLEPESAINVYKAGSENIHLNGLGWLMLTIPFLLMLGAF